MQTSADEDQIYSHHYGFNKVLLQRKKSAVYKAFVHIWPVQFSEVGSIIPISSSKYFSRQMLSNISCAEYFATFPARGGCFEGISSTEIPSLLDGGKANPVHVCRMNF